MGAIYSLDSDGEWHRPERTSLAGGRFMVGCTTSGLRGGTAATQQTTLESAVGYQSIRRCYAGKTNWSTSPYWTTSFLGAVDINTGTSKSIRTTHISWNPDCEALVTENPSGFDPTGLLAYLAAGRTGSGLSGYGTQTALNITWLLSCPTYAQCIWTPWHEADGNVGNSSGGYNWTSVAHFKLGLQIICDMVHAFANPLWETCLVLDAFVWKAESGSSLDPVNFWPGAGYIDIMGVDSYNEGSILSSPRWDSFQAGLGYPADSAEATAYQAAYGLSGTTAGMKSTDSSGLTWSNGFLGWCEAIGVTKWLVAETGTLRNVAGLSPTWPAGTSSKEQWINSMVTFINNYNIDGTHKAKCVALQYFSTGRNYTGSAEYSSTVHLLSDGSHASCVGANTFAGLPTSGNTTGDKRFTTDTSHVYSWSGSAWTDLGAATRESWELYWNEDGSGWDSGTCANSTWSDVTTVHNIRPTS